MILQLAFDQVYQLIRAIVGAFNLSGQPSIAPNDRGGGIVTDRTLVSPIDLAQRRRKGRHVASEEEP